MKYLVEIAHLKGDIIDWNVRILSTFLISGWQCFHLVDKCSSSPENIIFFKYKTKHHDD